jgi:arylsulfatase A-like enzyme
MNKFKSILCLSLLIGIILFFNSDGLPYQNSKSIKFGAYAGYNILFVSFDALQAAHTSCLGYFRKTTPTIDHFAEGGFLFKNAISESSWTVPSSMSWFTSLYPSQHKCINKYSTYTEKEKILTNLKELSPDVITLAEVLKRNGYMTAGFTGDAGVSGRFGFNQGFDVYIDGPKFGGMDHSIPLAIEWLRNNSNKKFFMFLHGYDSHGQYDPPNGYTKRFLDFDYKGPLKGGKEEQGKFREEGLEKGYITLTDDDVRFWRALYDEKINDVDERFRQFIEELKKLGLLDKTIVVLTSDHGTEFYEHKRFDHGFSLYDELIHVPLIFWLPNAKGGRVIEDQVRGIDIMPTLLDLLGVKVSKKVRAQMKGVSLTSLMRDGHMELEAFSETDYRFYTHKRSIRTNDGWKFIYTMETGQRELYNLKDDPKELNNLAEKEKRIAYELEQRLFNWLKTMGQDENYYEKILADVLKIKEY